jgi:hypothetical protein
MVYAFLTQFCRIQEIKMKNAKKIIQYLKFIVFVCLFITSSGLAEYRIDSYFPKSGVVGKDMVVQLDGQFSKNAKAVLYPSKENILKQHCHFFQAHNLPVLYWKCIFPR